MNRTAIIVVVGLVLVAVAVVRQLAPGARPKYRYFRCARCGASTEHSERTINAWRQKKTRFYCHACHVQWLKSLPVDRSGHDTQSASSGCLGAVAMLAVVPIAAMLWWAYA